MVLLPSPRSLLVSAAILLLSTPSSSAAPLDIATASPTQHQKIQHHVNAHARRQLPAATPTAPSPLDGKCANGGILCSGVCHDPGVYSGCASGVPVKLVKRTMKNAQCYATQELCPIRAGSSLSECVFTQIDIESCGGCLYPNLKELARSGRNFTLGQDCTAIPNIAEVACIRGTCVVHACIQGFIIDPNDSAACVPQSGTAEDPKMRYRLT